MSEKSDLYARIDECNRQINIINQDINSMSQEKENVRGYLFDFNNQKDDVRDYDMTVGDTWRKQLCDQAIEIQRLIFQGIGSAAQMCENTMAELDRCISEARRMIRELESTISSCRARIAQIEAEERAAAERAEREAREAAAYRASMGM